MKVDRKAEVTNKLRNYHLNLLSKLIAKSDYDRINQELISYDNNDSGIIRVIGCPYKNNNGGVIYILKSSKKDIANYKLLNSIVINESGLLGTSISISTDSKVSHKNKLVFTSIDKDQLKVYIYSKFLNKNMSNRVLNLSLKTSDNNSYLKNIITLIDGVLVVRDSEMSCRQFIISTTMSLIIIKEKLEKGFFRNL